MDQRLPGDVAEQLELLAEQGGPAVAKKFRLIPFMAVVRLGSGVPGQPVGLVDISANRHECCVA